MFKHLATAVIVTLSLSSSLALAAPPRPVPPTQYPNIIAGVDLGRVDWEKLCSNVKPVTVTRGGVTCANVYPTSVSVRRWVDVSGSRPVVPPVNCEIEQSFLTRMMTPKPTNNPWSACRVDFTEELKARSGTFIPYDDMPLEQWRKKYFGPWLVGTGGRP